MCALASFHGGRKHVAYPASGLQASFEKKTFRFKRPAGTSRGVLTEKHAWFIYLWETDAPEVIGTGECSVIPGLSPDFEDVASYESQVKALCDRINNGDPGVAGSNPVQTTTLENISSLFPTLESTPSLLFGLETAFLDLLHGGKALFYDTAFTRGEEKLPINGLIWMGTEDFMQAQISEKLQEGYSCIKMKIGAIDFEKEFEILAAMRKQYDARKLTLRVDANGAFSPEEALEKLGRLAALDIHSIEQPIKAGQWHEMARLCGQTKLPIALDEELIGIYGTENKRELLETIRPQYIILKPSLHGGISGTKEWIRLAESLGIPWWITSALESNVGLNAIAQFTSTYDITIPQGLGTGSLYVENTPTNLRTHGGFLQIS